MSGQAPKLAGPEFVQHMRDSRGKGSPEFAGKWAETEHSKPPKGKKLRQSGKPAGFSEPRNGTTKNAAAFQRRMLALKRVHPEVAARIARQADRGGK